MTKAQLTVIWIVGPLVCALLFYVGIGKPYLADREDEKMLRTMDVNLWMMSKQALINTVRQCEERWKLATGERWGFHKADYYTGALAPILILGACAFLSTLKRKGD